MSRVSPPSSSGEEEEEDEGVDAYRKGGYHAVRPGDQFSAGRYVAQRKLGWGNFSTVWLAFDTLSQKFVALKIQKSAPEFAQAAFHEIEFLSEITKGDPSNCKCIIQLLDHFKHIGPNGQHICLVFEFLGDSLLKLVQYNRYKGIGLDRVREICKFILVGLDYLHRELGIIHSDLKLENVLLVSTIDPSKDPIRCGLTPILERPEGNPNGEVVLNPIEKKLKMRARRVLAKLAEKRKSSAQSSRLERSLDGIDMRCKIVDFGNACWADKQFTDNIQTRQYRAPEVILGAGYSFSVDMWSLACIAFELATGEMLFTPKEGHGYSEDEDHLALMMELLGKMPKKIATTGTQSKEYFDRHGDLKRIRRLKFSSMDRILIDKYNIPESEARNLADFLCPLLDFAPEKRPTAEQCLQHPWLQFNDDKTYGAVNSCDAKNIDVTCNTGNIGNSDAKNIDAKHDVGSNADGYAKNIDVKHNTESIAKNDAENIDVKCNVGSIADSYAKNMGVKCNTGSVANRDAKSIDVKPNIGTVAHRDGKNTDVKPYSGRIASKDSHWKNIDIKSSIGSFANSYAKHIDVKRNTGNITNSDAKNFDVKLSTGIVVNSDAKNSDTKLDIGSIACSDAKNSDTKLDTGSIADSDAKGINVKPNTASDADADTDIKPSTGRVAASIQRLESSMGKVQIGRYR